MTATTAVAEADRHPIGLIVEDDLKRNRLTVFFRLLLAIPLAIWIAIWGIVTYIVVFIAWFAALFTGRVPEGLHNFMARFLRAGPTEKRPDAQRHIGSPARPLSAAQVD